LKANENFAVNPAPETAPEREKQEKMMPRHCPDCGAQMEDDTLHCWCPSASCTFEGYVVLQTGKILREPEGDDHHGGFDECGLTDDGLCMLAGTEHCDWDCPHSR
jgi:hypothetical protein